MALSSWLLPLESFTLCEVQVSADPPRQPEPPTRFSLLSSVCASLSLTCALFSLNQEKGKCIDDNSLNSVIYSFIAHQDKLKELLSENAAGSLFCKCRYFVKSGNCKLTCVWSDCVRLKFFLFYFFIQNCFSNN